MFIRTGNKLYCYPFSYMPTAMGFQFITVINIIVHALILKRERIEQQ